MISITVPDKPKAAFGSEISATAVLLAVWLEPEPFPIPLSVPRPLGSVPSHPSLKQLQRCWGEFAFLCCHRGSFFMTPRLLLSVDGDD